MAYLVLHHEIYWFQIRVPAPLVDRYGSRLIRQNLQTRDRALAQQLAYPLAGHWLMRFSTERGSGCECQSAMVQIADSADAMTLLPQASAPTLSPPTQAAVMPHETSQEIERGTRNESKVVDSLDALSRYWRTLHPECSSSTISEVDSVVKGFSKAIPKSLSQLERTDIAAYRDQLIASGLARATVAKKVSFVSRLLQTAVDAGMLPHNVARGMRIPKSKVEHVSRRAFTTKELQRIFSSPIYSRQQRYTGGGGEAAAWVPLLALTTGARLEELCQLKVSDIVLNGEHGPLMRISDAGDGQHVKTTSSRRIIPLHRDLISAGFIKYWDEIEDSGHEWLFPVLGPDHDGRRGGNFGKWFARYLRSSKGCAIRDPSVVLHSFRHTFKTLCREAGINEETHDALTGHAGLTVGRSYGHMPQSTLVEAVARIRFPVPFPAIAN
jgi:integrase